MRRAEELYRREADRTAMGTLIDQATRIRDQELMELLVKTAGQPNAATGVAGRDRAARVSERREVEGARQMGWVGGFECGVS